MITSDIPTSAGSSTTTTSKLPLHQQSACASPQQAPVGPIGGGGDSTGLSSQQDQRSEDYMKAPDTDGQQQLGPAEQARSSPGQSPAAAATAGGAPAAAAVATAASALQQFHEAPSTKLIGDRQAATPKPATATATA